MPKIYAAFLLIVLLLSKQSSQAQTINLLSNPTLLCTGQPVSLSFATSGTFAAGNTFRVQVSSNSGDTYVDVPGSFTSSPASVTLPAGSTSYNYVYRIVADKPLVVSGSSYTFRILDKPSALLTGSSAGAALQNPYTPTDLYVSLKGGAPYTITLQNGAQFTKNYDYYNSETLPVSPTQTTTYSLSSVQNGCGTGPVSGSATVLVNSVGFRLIERVNESFCLGSQLPVYFSTTSPLPANTLFNAELVDTYDGNRSIALPVTGTTSPLLVTLPKQFPSNNTYGYKLRIYSREANVSAWLREGNTFTLATPPRLSLSTTIASIPFGGQTSLIVSYSTTNAGEVLLSDGQQINLFGGSFGSSTSTNVAPSATTSYSIVSYTGACGDATTYATWSATVQVRPGVRIDSLSATEVCAGQPVTVYYTATPGYTLPPRLRMQYGYSFSTEVQAVRPGQLVFTPPASSTPIQSQVLQLKNAQADTLIAQVTSPLLIKSKPIVYFATTQRTLPNPGQSSLEVTVVASGTTSFTLSTGDRFTAASISGQGYSNTLYIPVYISRTTSFSVVSASNECGTTDGPGGTASITVQNTAPPVTGLTLTKVEQNQNVNCPGSRQWLNVQPTGTFGVGNLFQVEVSDPTERFTGSPVQSFSTTDGISFVLPTAPGYYRVRVSSTNPVTQSNEQNYYISSPPAGSVYLSTPAGISSVDMLTVTPGQLVNASYNFSSGRSPYRYELANGSRGQANYGFQITYQPTASARYGIVRLTDACGVTATSTGSAASVVVTSALLRTGNVNTSQVCAQMPLLVPFTHSGSVPASVSYAVQLSENLTAWQTVPTSGTTSPLLATIPASMAGKAVYYRVTALTGSSQLEGIPYSSKLTVRVAPNTLLTTPSGVTTVAMDRNSYVELRLTDVFSEVPTVVLSNGSSFITTYASVQGNSVYVNQPGSYSIISIRNACGYGTAQGTVQVTEKPYLALAKVNNTLFCVGQTVSFSYAVGGDLGTSNALAIYLANNYGGANDRTLLTETTATSGAYSFSLNPSLRPSSYSIQIDMPASKATLTLASLDVESPVSATLLTGRQVVYQNDMQYIPVYALGNRPFSMTLATPEGLLADVDPSYVSVRVTQSGSYSIAAIANRCGPGKATGSYSFTALPVASVTIRPLLYGSYFCTGKSYVTSVNTTGTFDASNTFTAYLSDSTGANVRTLPSISRGSQLTITVPADLPRSDNYILRVGSSSPQHLGASIQQSFATRQVPTGTLTGNTSILKGDSTRLSVALTGTAPWQLTITDFFGPRTFTASTSPFTLTVKPDTTSGYRLAEVRDSQCGVGTALGTALITVSRLLATEPALALQVRIWPNPTSGWLQVEGELPGQGEVSFELHTTSGRLVQRSVGGVRQGKLEHRIDLSGQPAGGYVLTADQAGRRSQFKIIKQ